MDVSMNLFKLCIDISSKKHHKSLFQKNYRILRDSKRWSDVLKNVYTRMTCGD